MLPEKESNLCCLSPVFLTAYEGINVEVKGDHQIQDEIPPGISV